MAVTAFEMNENQLLAALPPQDSERWRSSLERVVLAAGQVLNEGEQAIRHAYFPIGAVVSLQVPSADGGCDEVAIVGREGMVGVATFMGGGSSTLRLVVQSAGRALRLSAEGIRAEVEASRTVMRLLLRYVASQDWQVAQGVVCSRHHKIQQRLSLRLLLGMERQQDSRLAMTHEQLSLCLGVRRESVTEEASKLQKAGLIGYSRGRINVLDRVGLEQRACACFSLITSEYQRREGSCGHAETAPAAGPSRLLPHGQEHRGVLRAISG